MKINAELRVACQYLHNHINEVEAGHGGKQADVKKTSMNQVSVNTGRYRSNNRYTIPMKKYRHENIDE